jgi:cytoskeletal protein CcmA (bactofilin family)
MEEKNKNDLKVNGIMTLPGGIFNNVKINGQLALTSDLECSEFYVNGILTVTGNLKAGKGKVNGKACFKGDVEADAFYILGKTDITGNSKINDLKVEGQLESSGNLLANDINIFGEVTVKGDCNAELFKSKGAFSIGGLLNSGTVDVELHGKCSANEIGGEQIKIVKGTDYYFKKLVKSIFNPFNLFDGYLTINTIEGDEIYLENTKAKIVRGDKVKIGPNCEIGIVEFKNKFELNDKSTVTENKKI